MRMKRASDSLRGSGGALRAVTEHGATDVLEKRRRDDGDVAGASRLGASEPSTPGLNGRDGP